MTPPTHTLVRLLTIVSACATAACAPSNDVAGEVHPDSASEASDLRRIRHDADHDGYARAPWGKDCDDARAAVNPGAIETCATTYDDDCDGTTNERNARSCTDYFRDADRDSFGDAADSVCTCAAFGSWDTLDSTDCDDSSAAVNPDAVEISGDGIDQDCDGTDPAPADTGVVDTGVVDTGVVDTGVVDTGGTDSGGTGTGDAPLYGYWGLNGYLTASGLADVEGRLGMSVMQLACATPNYCVNTVLPMIRSAGLHATFRMTPSPTYYTTSGNFDIAKWKTELDDWKGYDVQQYIDDGTLVGHMILDDIYNYSGRDATAADLDEMARYSKAMFPGLMTFVRERATKMPTPSGGTYVYVDACVNQYRARDGEINTYAAAEEAKAKSLGLGVINGLNLADGGDGSSGQPGWRTDGAFWAMSAAEITEYGNVLANVPSMGMFLNWEYDGEEAWSDGTIGADYLDQPDLQSALSDLAVVVGSHAPVTLLR